MEKTLFDVITKDGQLNPHGLPASTELQGRTAVLPDGTEIRFSDGPAVKCDDDVFLACEAGQLLLVRELPDESLKAVDAEKETAGKDVLPEDLEGWETEISLSPGTVFSAVFKDGALTLCPAPEVKMPNFFGAPEPKEEEPVQEAPKAPPVTLPLEVAETGEKHFLIRFKESGEILFFNGRRFLFYGILKGRIVCGFAEVPQMN